MRNTASS